MTRAGRWLWWCSIAVTLASCSSVPVSPEQRRVAERRLLSPFLSEREVGCSELQIEITGNFHGNVAQPAIDRTRHTVTEQRGDGFKEMVWTNTAGTPDAAFVITIGEPTQIGEEGWVAGQRTTFRVVNQVRLRIHESRRELMLEATAGGTFLFVKDGKSAPREMKRFVIADGVLQQS